MECPAGFTLNTNNSDVCLWRWVVPVGSSRHSAVCLQISSLNKRRGSRRWQWSAGVFYGGGVLLESGALDIGWGHLIHRRQMERDWEGRYVKGKG